MCNLYNYVGNWTSGQNMDWKMGRRRRLMNCDGGEHDLQLAWGQTRGSSWRGHGLPVVVTASASPVSTADLRQGSDRPHFPLILSWITLVLISYSTNIWVCSDFHFSWFKPDTYTPKWPLTLSRPFTIFNMQKICIGKVAGDFWHSQRELSGLNICQFSLNVLWFLVVLWFLLDHLMSITQCRYSYSHFYDKTIHIGGFKYVSGLIPSEC